MGVRAGETTPAGRRDLALRGQLNQRASEYPDPNVAAVMRMVANLSPNSPEGERCELCSHQLAGAFEAGFGIEPPGPEEMKTLV